MEKPTDPVIEIMDADAPASAAPSAHPRRSKSRVRARKRANFELESQKREAAAEEDDENTSRSRAFAIADAIEANAALARSGVVAWPDCAAWRPKSMFDLYYRLQRIVHISEWEYAPARQPISKAPRAC